jgi:hypothetical protein
MPITPMHENGLLLPGDYKVRFSGQVMRAATVSNPHSPHKPAHYHLRLRALGTDPTHYLAALGNIKRIHISLWPNVGQNFDQCYHFGNLPSQSGDRTPAVMKSSRRLHNSDRAIQCSAANQRLSLFDPSFVRFFDFGWHGLQNQRAWGTASILLARCARPLGNLAAG